MKANDTVKCVSVEEGDEQGLVVGKEYIIETIDDTYIKVKGLLTSFFKERFELVEYVLPFEGDKNFLRHKLAEAALTYGWNFEKPLSTFVEELVNTNQDAQTHVVYVVGYHDLSLKDLYLAYTGKATNKFVEFFKALHKQLQPSYASKPTTVAMHSLVNSVAGLNFSEIEHWVTATSSTK